MRIGISKIPKGGLNYKETFEKTNDTINKVKQNNAVVGVIEE